MQPSKFAHPPLVEHYHHTRRATVALAEPLSAEDCQAQSMDDASPTKWHLGHTTWFFETFVLAPAIGGYRPFHPDFRTLFNSYYQAVGEQHPRRRRGLLTRPSLDEVRAYRDAVDDRMTALLARAELPPQLLAVTELGLHHEQQHQELILTDIKHLFAANPLCPAYLPPFRDAPPAAPALHWRHYEEGLCWIGHDGRGFAFDNESPRHRVVVRGFELASRLVTNAEYLEFMEAGGYARPDLWLSDGWATVQARGWNAPLYWERCGEGWFSLTLRGRRQIHPGEPVCHVSLYEADAFARWRQARLPSEAEWEVAGSSAPSAGNFVESGRLHPTAASAGEQPAQLFGDVWEWTQSPYGPYPGYRPPAGALGEYNGKFMCNQFVLRGGSCVTPRSHIRATYRNFFPADARWQFTGIRLARDA
jgi:ergothioneine biosynthesis protein EgtB